MKTKILWLLILLSQISNAQDTIPTAGSNNVGYIHPNRLEVFFWIKEKNQFFAISPMSKRIEKVNGMAFGFGHLENNFVKEQTLNGLNLEINPAPAVGALVGFMALMYLPDIIRKKDKAKPKVADSVVYAKEDYMRITNFLHNPTLKVNGLNLSTGCFFVRTDMNGLNISFANKFRNFNGVSIAPLGTISDRQMGFSVGLINASNELNGWAVGAYNQTFKLDGLQLGLVNNAAFNHGLQIGLINNSRSKGFQIGIWNKNARRSLPILNW